MITKFPQYSYKIHISLYSNAQNIEQLQERILGRDEILKNYVFLNTQHIVSMEHLLSAIYLGLSRTSNTNQESPDIRSVVTESICSLGNLRSRTSAFKLFGIDLNCNSVYVIRFENESDGGDAREEYANEKDIIKGTEVSLDDEVIWKLVDVESVCKLFKLSKEYESIGQDELTRLVIGMTALRGF